MCIAILAPKGKAITAQQFRNCWDNNFNGAGFMYNDDQNKLHVVKEMESFDNIYKKYKASCKKFPKATFLIHFRISTHGVINKANCHPFKVNKNLGFIHNGVIAAVDKNEEHSDTNVFNRQILRKIPGMSIELMNNPAIKNVFGEYIKHSKLVFMDNMGNTAIVNEQKGSWEEDGIWYSNDSHKRVKTTVDFGGKTMTRAELSNLQGGRGTEDSVGIGYRASNLSRKSSGFDYALTGSTWSSNVETVGSNGLNSRVGKKYESYEIFRGDHFVMSDGTLPCQSCGVHTLVGELMSTDEHCLECLPPKEAADIMQEAVNEGALLTSYGGTTVVDTESMIKAEEEEEAVDCDSCQEIVTKSQTKYFNDWGARLCSKCIDDFIDAGVIDDDCRLNKQVNTPDAMELMFPNE